MNRLEPELQKLSDAALRDKTAQFRRSVEQGTSLDQLLPETFAVVREAARRSLRMRHFDVQLLGGIALHRGFIAEMLTGEGKTLVATLATYLNALAGKGVQGGYLHIMVSGRIRLPVNAHFTAGSIFRGVAIPKYWPSLPAL